MANTNMPAVPGVVQTGNGYLLQPAATTSYYQNTATAPMLQPAATTKQLQPAATAQQLQPTATTKQIQPAVGGLPIVTTPGSETYSYNGQTYQRPATGYDYSQPASQPAPQPSFNFMDGGSLGSSGYKPPTPAPSKQVASYQSPLPSPIPQIPQLPKVPQSNTSQASELEKLVASFYNLSPEEMAAQAELNKQNEAYLMGMENTRNKVIPMEMIRGQQESISRMNTLKEIPLQQKLALAQAKRTSALDASKFALSREDKKAELANELEQQALAANKPISVGDGGALIDPKTGQVIYQNEKEQTNSYSLGFDPVSGNPYVLNSRTGQLNNNGAFSGYSSGSLGTDLVGQLAQQVQQNPALLNSLPEAQKKAVISRLAQSGQQIPNSQPMAETTIQNLSQLQTGLSALQELQSIMENNKQYIGPIAGLQALNPYSQARQVQADIDRVRQLIGKALEGGVLRKEDEEKYKKILPTMNDTYETAMYKIEQLNTGLQSQINAIYQQQGGAGRATGTQQQGVDPNDPLGIRAFNPVGNTSDSNQVKGWTSDSPVSFGGYAQSVGSGVVIKGSQYHTGHEIDIDGKIGDPIPAYRGGIVIDVVDQGNKAYGRKVVVQAPDGSTYIYGHLNSFNVQKGQLIAPGQTVGQMGNTGNVTPMGGGDGSHLHIERRDSNGKVVPL